YVPEGLAVDRLHEGGDVQPLVPVMTQRDRPLTFGRPHPPDDRLQPNAVLVGGPDLDRRVGVLGSRLSDGLLQLFLNASRSSGVAAAGWRGRGFCTHPSIALMGSPTRWGKASARARCGPTPRALFRAPPAAWGKDCGEPDFARHPGRHFAAGPQAAIGRRRLEPRAPTLEKRRPEHARHAALAAAPRAPAPRAARPAAREARA